MNPIIYCKTLASLFTNPSAISQLLTKNLWFVVRFFVISIFLISLVDSGVLLGRTFPTWIEKLQLQAQEAVKHYPSDLIINWDGQTLILEPEQNIELPYPEQIIETQTELPPLLGLVVPQADWLTQSEAQNLDHPSALFYITQKNLYINSPSAFGQNWSQEPLSQLTGFHQPFTITSANASQVADETISQLVTTVNQGWPWIVAGMFIYLLIIKLWVVSWYGLAGWLFYRFNAERMNLSRVAKLTLYISVPAQTLSSLANLLYQDINISYVFGLSYLVIFVVFFLQLGQRKVSRV